MRRQTTAVAAVLSAAIFVLAGCTGSGSTPTSSSTPASGSASGSTSGQSGASASPDAATAATVNTRIQLGITQAEQKLYTQAKATFQSVLDLEPDNKYAWFNLGLIAQNQNDPKTALANYGRALQTDPAYTPAMFNKAIVLEATDIKQSIQIYQQIVVINPKASTAFLRLGLALNKQGDTAGATTAFKQALSLDKTLISSVPTKYRPATTTK